jgi:hyperosmotically inducible periplasmic protein
MLKMSSAIVGTFLLIGMSAGLDANRGGTLQTPSATKPATKPEAQKPDPGPTTRVRDGWITMKIHSQYIPEDALEDSNIDVDTMSGVVTLSGTVANEAGRARAVAIAKATDGVKSVNDKLRIAPEGDKGAGATGREAKDAAKSGGRRVTDGWIKSKIYAQFLTENALEDSDIDVDVRTGAVTLNGTVATDAGRDRAVALAKATDGVKSVKDALKVVKR